MYYFNKCGLFIIFLGLSNLSYASSKCYPLPRASETSLEQYKKYIISDYNAKKIATDTIHIEHSLPGEPNVKVAMAAFKQFRYMRSSALIWQNTGEEKYLSYSKSRLLDWINVYKPSVNPIDETDFDSLIDTYQIVKSTLTNDEIKKIDVFLVSWANKYIESIENKKKNKIKPFLYNNWQSHRIKIITKISDATNNEQLYLNAKSLFEEQVENNIYKNGDVYDFHERDALSYVVFDLVPLLQAAFIAKKHGDDWFNYKNKSGSSVSSAIKWLVPYMNGEKKHAEFVNTQSDFDKKRISVGMKDFKGNFNPVRAAPLFWMASEFDNDYLSLAKSLKPNPGISAVVCENE